MTIHSGNRSKKSTQELRLSVGELKPGTQPRWSWAAAPLAMLLCQGALALAVNGAIAAEPKVSVLVAQEFNFEAPPPPSDQFPSVIVPRDPTLPTLEPAPAPFPNSAAPVSAPSPSIRALPSETYLVFVNGNSPLMLDQVRRVEPEAFRKEYRGRTVIQVGQFIDQSNARRRAEALQDQGIRAEVAQVSGSGSGNSASAKPKGYYVVVPAGNRELAAIRDQVKRLAGDLRVNVIPREKPRGQHIAVGPFTNWDAANSWNRYVKDFGINNARVYYGR
ncbi:SPOR domain-containing protein [Trichocoleus sp. FACHB-591]|uniref:SPOR domain-containing protein n=1 Tax=Trichocoleus sp. FACHB-591 TaxID=2692872 RepID=UPI001684D1E2|nr:SPOR domain-containing protein [Trichocoleus sp. FACHB-591]MBD2099012.1 SPOR domain-containing protein [Trichocoleus sp. FACHB-591]